MCYDIFKMQRSTVESRTGYATLAVPHPLHQYRNRFHHQLQLKLPMGIPSPFCNSTQMASATNRLNFTTVRKDRGQDQGGGLLTLIHKSINFSRTPDSPDTLADPHLEELIITAKLGNTDLIITNVYIPPASSCRGGYNPSLDHLMMPTDTLILGDFNAHRGIQVLQIREALCWRAWCMALISVF